MRISSLFAFAASCHHLLPGLFSLSFFIYSSPHMSLTVATVFLNTTGHYFPGHRISWNPPLLSGWKSRLLSWAYKALHDLGPASLFSLRAPTPFFWTPASKVLSFPDHCHPLLSRLTLMSFYLTVSLLLVSSFKTQFRYQLPWNLPMSPGKLCPGLPGTWSTPCCSSVWWCPPVLLFQWALGQGLLLFHFYNLHIALSLVHWRSQEF